jgi:hypothetical protein
VAKEKLTVWVEVGVAKAIRAKAASEKSDVSNVAAALLKAAVQEGTVGSSSTRSAVGAFRKEIRGAVREAVNDLASVASKAALYAIAGRLEVMRLMEEELGVEVSRKVHNEAWRRAIEALRKPLNEVS